MNSFIPTKKKKNLDITLCFLGLSLDYKCVVVPIFSKPQGPFYRYEYKYRYVT